MNESKAAAQRRGAIERFQHSLEDGSGAPKPEKAVEWSLLEIAGLLRAIHHTLVDVHVDMNRLR